jgi:formylmethanofuran dehydrogenase subunit E
MTEQEIREWLEVGLKFHGHFCGGLPLGFKAGVLAMETLGVQREPDYELIALAETAEYHMAGCWVDGIMLATGCTYGKGLIYKLFWGKWAVTLVDRRTSRAVRVSVRPEVLERMQQGKFLELRRQGLPPSQIPEEVSRPFFDSIAFGDPSQFFAVSGIFEFQWQTPPPAWDLMRCESCGEVTVVRHMRVLGDGKRVCIPCARSRFDYPPELFLTRGPECAPWPGAAGRE